MATKDKIDFMALVCGIPNHVVTQLLSEATPGVNFVGCTKARMLQVWDGKEEHTYRIDRAAFVRSVEAWRKEQTDRKYESIKHMLHLKPGDEVTILVSDRTDKITKVTSVNVTKGEVTVDGWNMPFTLDGYMMRSPYNIDRRTRIEATTEEHRIERQRQVLLWQLRGFPWQRLTSPELEKVLAMATALRKE